MPIVPTINMRGENLLVKWFINQKTFFVPFAFLYLGFVITRVTQTGFSLFVFIPSDGEQTALALYILNALYDWLRKIKESI